MAATVTATECIEASPLHSTYEVEFFGTTVSTTVTSTPSVMGRWLHHAAHGISRGLDPTVVGMGVQWNPDSGPDEADTLQICVGESCLIVQLYHADNVPAILRRFLLDPSYTFVGIWNHSDARRLAECDHELQMARPPLDLRHYVGTRYGEPLRLASFETIVEEFLGFRGVALERDISMSCWDDYELTEEQVSQATVDAYVSFRIGDDIDAWQYD